VKNIKPMLAQASSHKHYPHLWKLLTICRALKTGSEGLLAYCKLRLLTTFCLAVLWRNTT